MDLITNTWKGLCLPGKVYLVLALLSIASSIGAPEAVNKKGKPVGTNKGWAIAGNLLWSLVWVWVISMLCQAGWNKTAWVLAIGLPVLVMILIVAAIMGYLYEKAN